MPHLTHPQRQLLQHFAPRLSQSVIAKYLGVHRSTISRELKRYSINGVYNAMYASFARKQKRAIANGLMMRTGMRYGLVTFYKKISMRLPNPYRFWRRRVRPACLTYTSVDTTHNVETLHATSVPTCKPDQTDKSIKTSVSNETSSPMVAHCFSCGHTNRIATPKPTIIADPTDHTATEGIIFWRRGLGSNRLAHQ
ncbi:helix-turn-helix domain-containing protein [Persicobacter psychrovividus]|uniref:Transposase IS30-like HTH domain-containing protein n=1 Tax=Persicobacter psychrovividus TaxID=387638 RepID=A0ABM7VID3_9BACT|nr:hypothetical protein PEPS_30150 [Persicobacter psychrovividus]